MRIAFPVESTEGIVGDLAYVGIIVAFFALMLAYIKGCVALGKEESADAERT